MERTWSQPPRLNDSADAVGGVGVDVKRLLHQHHCQGDSGDIQQYQHDEEEVDIHGVGQKQIQENQPCGNRQRDVAEPRHEVRQAVGAEVRFARVGGGVGAENVAGPVLPELLSRNPLGLPLSQIFHLLVVDSGHYQQPLRHPGYERHGHGGELRLVGDVESLTVNAVALQQVLHAEQRAERHGAELRIGIFRGERHSEHTQEIGEDIAVGHLKFSGWQKFSGKAVAGEVFVRDMTGAC